MIRRVKVNYYEKASWKIVSVCDLLPMAYQ